MSVFSEPILLVCITADTHPAPATRWNFLASEPAWSHEFALYDGAGGKVCEVQRVRPKSSLAKQLNLRGSDITMAFIDNAGNPFLVLLHEGEYFLVRDPAGTRIGFVKTKNSFSKTRYMIDGNGQSVGSIETRPSAGVRASFRNNANEEVARFGRLEEPATAEKPYAVSNALHTPQPLDEPMRSLVLASAIGFSISDTLPTSGG